MGGVTLEARVIVPPGPPSPRPAFAYFHPGGWRAGSPAFTQSLRYLATRGLVAASFAYRLLPNGRKADGQPGSRFGAARSKVDCVADAQAAIRWLRARPEVDGNRIAASGYSAGAHLAAATALLPPVEPDETPYQPNALVLYAGVFAGTPELSPLAHIRGGAPPALVLYGVRDSLAGQNRRFARAMAEAGNRCEIAEFQGAHGAFAESPHNPVFTAALVRVDEFLVSVGYLEPSTNIAGRIASINADLPAPKRLPRRVTAAP